MANGACGVRLVLLRKPYRILNPRERAELRHLLTICPASPDPDFPPNDDDDPPDPDPDPPIDVAMALLRLALLQKPYRILNPRELAELMLLVAQYGALQP